jgi:hypothetical protein
MLRPCGKNLSLNLAKASSLDTAASDLKRMTIRVPSIALPSNVDLVVADDLSVP